MCKSKDCQHKKESPIKDWKRRCKYGPDGKRLQPGTVIVGWNDLATTHPRLAKECLDDATKFTGGSAQRKTWKCSVCGHKWPAPVERRTAGAGCKPCGNKRSAKKRSIVPYKKSVAYLFPHLVREHRGPGDLRSLSPGSGSMENWECKDCGHKWPAPLENRTKRGRGCEPCGRKLAAKKRSIVPYKKSVAYLFPHLVREHRGPGDLRSLGPGSGSMEKWECKDCGHEWPAPVWDRVRGRGCEPCGIKRRAKNRSIVPYKKSVAYLFPHLVREHRGPSDLRSIGPSSHSMENWECKDCGHKWPATVGNRVRGTGCKPCGRKRAAKKRSTVPYKKSVAYLFPHLVREHRGPGDLRSLGPSSGSMENWECKDCGHKWPAIVADRVSGSGCSNCAKYGIKLEKPSFFYLIKKPDRFKIGIANHNSGRLNKHRRAGWELIESIDMIGYAADSLEDACLAALNSKGVPLGQFGEIFDGYTESWYKRHLTVRTIRELCDFLGIDLDAFLAA